MGTPKRERHKENRQARLEAERAAAAKAKRRRTLITTVVVSLLLFGALIVIANLGGEDEAATPTTTTTVADDPTAEQPEEQPERELPETDPADKPEVEVPEGDLPTELVIEDLVEGDGAEATEGDTVTVHYVGVSASTGEEFDSSWDRGEPATFPLQGLIPGWQEGIPGMKVGGQRQLVIPPELGYGEAGSPPAIGPNETLVFVIDLVDVGG